MALTVTNVTKSVFGDKRAVVASLAFDSSYPTGGEALTAANLGLTKIDFLIAEPSAGYSFEYDHTNSKLLAYTQRVNVTDSDTAASAGVAVYLDEDGATEEAKLLFVSPTNADATVDLSPVQVADTTDLSALTGVRLLAFGH